MKIYISLEFYIVILRARKRLGLNNDVEQFNRIIDTLSSFIIQIKKNENKISEKNDSTKKNRLNYDRIIWIGLSCYIFITLVLYDKTELSTVEAFKKSLETQITQSANTLINHKVSHDDLDENFALEAYNNEKKIIKNNLSFLDKEIKPDDAEIIIRKTKKICLQNISIF